MRNRAESRPRYLIAAVSARALACSAARAGIAVHVIDLFADADTREVSASATALPQGLDSPGLTEAADAVDPEHESQVIYGGGFEGAPDRLRALCEHRALCGNAPEVLDLLCDPERVAQKLTELGVPRPAFSSGTPAAMRGWLIKRAGSCGGVHVREATTGPARDGEYYQRKLEGHTLSVTLLADGESAQAIGYAEQWHALQDGTRLRARAPSPFLFGGAVSLPADALPATLRAEIEHAASKLSTALGLVGLNALDVIVNGTTWALVDINARPGFCF
ncbi:MAG: ATP-grasp domain-containing protein, partial [Gammaproteobacteria bacterium]